jgi:hypothetical protein
MTEDERRSRMEKALHYGGDTHAIGDIAALIKEGRAQWWQHGDGMIVTEIDRFPRFSAVRYWLIFGELKECLSLEDQINEWAIGEGCTMAVATGRRGWGRVAASTGWRHHMYTFYKPLVS